MPTQIKIALQPNAAGPGAVIYECPAGKTAIVKSCIAANTGEAIATMPVMLGVKRAGVFTALTGQIGITSTGSVNLLAGTITMEPGDKLVANSAQQSPFKIIPDALPAEMPRIYSMRARGTTLIAATAAGIWRTLDARNWTKVADGAANTWPILSIGTTWFVYSSATTALRSTDDGVTWNAIAVTNAPSNNTRVISGHSGRYAGAIFTGGVLRLTTTADGVTWTLGAATPNPAANALAWTGTHYVMGRNATTGDIYRSASGAAWDTVAAVITGTQFINEIVSDGAGTVIATANSTANAMVSTDHGATWESTGLDTVSNATYTGQVFALRRSTSWYVSASGLPGSYSESQHNPAISSFTEVTSYGSKILATAFTATGYFLESADLALTLSGYGLSASASLMEVS